MDKFGLDAHPETVKKFDRRSLFPMKQIASGIGEGDRTTIVDEAAYIIGGPLRQTVDIFRCRTATAKAPDL